MDRTSRADSLEYREYRTGSSLDHQAKVLSGISLLVWLPYKYKVYDRGTTATQGLSAWSWWASQALLKASSFTESSSKFMNLLYDAST